MPSLAALVQGAALPEAAIGMRFHNLRSEPQYISGDWAAKDTATHSGLETLDKYLQPKESIFFPAPANTSPKFYIGSTPNELTSKVGEKRNHDTIVEATFVGTYETTYYDVDFEKGFSSPLWCVGGGEKWHTGQGCLADVLALCPKDDRHHDAETGAYDQCRTKQTPDTVALWRQLCPGSYVLSQDPDTRTVPSTHGKFVAWLSARLHGLMRRLIVIDCYIMEPRMVNVYQKDLKSVVRES